LALPIAIIAVCLWLGGVRLARAEELVISLQSPPADMLQHDGGEDPFGPRIPSPSFRLTGTPVLTQVRVWPWPPSQGQTLAVVFESRAPVTFTLTFQERPYVVHSASGAGWSLVPIPPLTTPGYAPLVIRAGEQNLVLQVPVRAGVFDTFNIPAATAAPILSNGAKVNTETARMTGLFAGFTASGWTPRSRLVAPLRGQFPHTSPYGSRRTYGKDPTLSAHAGEDFSAPFGTPVYAPAAGQVVLAETLFVRGNAIVLDHGNGVFTGYWHLSELDVELGEAVAPGQLLGKVGSTGLSTGAHLHWELRIAGMAVDPLQWVHQ
jgi:murein DD-endopeptidase MepM/ murein hydrolase activator NlpD